jgi:multiple sugar transport system permease protein
MRVHGELVLAYVVLAIAAIAFALPFFWLVTTAFKPDQEIFAFPPHWLPNPPILDHFVKGLNAYPFGRFFLNSLTVSVLGAVGAVLSSSLAAYGLSRIDWPGRDFLFAAILGTILLPFQVRLIPLFLTYNALNWIDTLLPLFVPFFFGNAFAIFLLRQFFRSIPKDLSDAARIDGANEWQIYWRLFMPLAKPAIATVALLTFVERWDDYLGPLIFITSRENATVSLGLSLFRDQYGNSWGQLMAVTTVALVPIIVLFFFAQRTFIQGITLTGLK